MTTRSPLFSKLLLALCIIALGIIYAGQSDGELMFDDDHQIIHASGFSSIYDTFSVDFLGFFRPVKNLVFYSWSALLPDQYQVWRLTAVFAFLGLIPIAHLFFGLVWPEKPHLQLLSTVLWASAPALTTVVSWISSTNIIIGGYGFFLYFILYKRSRSQPQAENRRKVLVAGSLLAFGLACFSYEAAITAPFLLFFMEFTLNPQRLKEKQSWIFYLLSGAVLIFYFFLRKIHGGVTVFDIATTIPSNSDFWVSLGSGWMYLFHAIRWIFPFGHQGILIMFNPENHKVLVIFSAVLVIAIGLTLLIFRKAAPKYFLAMGWYALALFPMANVIPLRNGPIADYYLFLPSIGLAIFVAWLIQVSWKSRVRFFAAGVSVMWVLAFLVTTLFWASNWKSQRALAERTVAWQPDNFVILESLIKVELEDKRYDKARAYLKRGLDLAPWYSRLHYYKVMLHIQLGEATEAIELLDKLTRDQPQSPKPLVFLAYVHDNLLGQIQSAEKLLGQALEKPWDDRYSRMGAMNLASIYLRTERKQYAFQVYESLLARYPSDPEISQKYQSIQVVAAGL